MDVLPVFIDDWLSSRAVDDMDAEEERGYFRLCMHAAKLEFEGLPDDQRLLANWSRLGAQWNKPTRDKKFRSSLTSGEKILANFFKKDGRFFNKRVLEVVTKYKERQGKAVESANKRWHQDRMRSHCEGNATRVGVGNGNESTLPKTENAEGISSGSPVAPKPPSRRPQLVTPIRPIWPGSQQLWERWWEIWTFKRGTNHQNDAAQAWLSVVTERNAEAVFACTESYLASLPTPSPRGYNPENFLFDQYRDGFTARWPPHVNKRGQMLDLVS